MAHLKQHILFVLFVFCALLPSLVLSQGEDCSVDNPEACSVDLSLFCQQRGEVPFNFRLNLDTFDIDFTASFSEGPPANRFPLFFVDGEVESGNVNETRITTLRCKGNSCSGSITVEKADKLQTEFDFEQAVITVVLRLENKFGKDFCIGKFTNNPDLVSENDSSVRQICSLTTTSGNEAVTGTGFFAPGGYGTDGESRFHLSLEGLDTDTTYKLCSVVGENRYKKVASFTPVLLSTASDTDIYGTLTPKEQAAFDANPFLFSYELRSALSMSASSFSRELLFTPSLSLINKSVSSSASGAAIRQSNKKTRANRRRARRRKQKGNSSRSLLFALGLETSVEIADEETLAFLNFDPLGGTVILSENCHKNVLAQSIGTLVCGNDGEDDLRRCKFFSFISTDMSASSCKEVQDNLGQLTLRVRNSEDVSLTVCINGSPLANTLEVVIGTEDKDPDFPFAELKLTDNDGLVAGDSTFTKLGIKVSDVSTVALSSSGDCADTLSAVSF